MKVEVVEEVAAPIERAWPAFADFASVGELMPPGSVEVEGSGVGAIRSITAPGGVIRERLETLDDAGRTFSYAIINDDAPLPLSAYLATVRLQAISADRCKVHWSSEFEPRGVPEEQIRSGMEQQYRALIQQIGRKLAQ